MWESSKRRPAARSSSRRSIRAWRRTPLGEFLARSARRGGRPIAAVGRVRGADSTVVQRALRRAHERLGLPYDDEFLPANGKLYCSELAWECFVAADDSTHLLRSRPMTFRTADGELPAYWSEHFAALGMPVPEGVAGTNPNDMRTIRPSRSYGVTTTNSRAVP